MAETLIVIIGSILATLIGVFVVSRDFRQPINYVYGIMSLAFISLMIANALTTGESVSPESALIGIRVVIASTTVALTALYFLVTLVNNSSAAIFRKTSYQLVLAISLIVVFLDLSPLVFSGIMTRDAQMLPIVAPGVVAFFAHFIFFLVASLVILLKTMPKSKGLKRSQYITIMTGLVPVLLLAPITSFILPVVYGETSLIFLSPLYIVFFMLMVAYAMVKHGLFDLRQAAIRTFAYTLTLVSLALIYYALAFIASSILFNNDATLMLQSPISVTLALVLAFVFQPIKRFFDKLTNQFFYRESYDSDDFFARFNRKLISTTDLRKLLQAVASEIGGTLRADQAFFFIYSGDSRYITAGTPKHSKMPRADAMELDEIAISLGGDVIMADDMATVGPIRRMIVSHRLSVVLPLMQSNSVVGYLCLGEHKTSRYTERDIKVLEAIADALVIAIRNALSTQQVRELNDNLQQRINEATKELRLSNAQLRRLDEAKDEFVSMASHQLRTPLTSIKGYISMLLEEDAGKINSMQKHFLREAFTSSERMVRLINDFLNVSRLQTGRFVIDKKPTNLTEVVKGELASLESSASSRNLEFSLKAPKNVPILDLDEDKIRQVIMNFVDNAMFYSPEGSKIHVKLAVIGDEIEFIVKDKGIGVPKAEQARLFTKFYRASNARTQRPDGTGVGLFLAKKVIHDHGGDVTFESTEGKGSSFGFRLPVARLLSSGDSDNLKNKPNDN